MSKPIDIIIVTFNRRELLQETIEKIQERTKTPHRLIVVDNYSVEDDTISYLKKAKSKGIIGLLILNGENIGLPPAYNKAFKYVESELFVTTNDDLIPPDLEPDWLERLVKLFKKYYPEYGAVGLRYVRMRNTRFEAEWLPHYPNNELGEAERAMPAVFRMQKKSDLEKLKHPFGDKEWWDDHVFKGIMNKLGFRSGFAKNIWARHIAFAKPNKGYPEDFKDYLHYSEQRNKRDIEKGIAPMDPKTNEPLTDKY